MARQADAAVVVTVADTVVLVTAVGSKKVVPGRDFFPLTVNYQEKTYAAGRIPGGFFKREGRPSERETLTSRLIDRPIRPLFPEGFLNEVQVVATACITLEPAALCRRLFLGRLPCPEICSGRSSLSAGGRPAG